MSFSLVRSGGRRVLAVPAFPELTWARRSHLPPLRGLASESSSGWRTPNIFNPTDPKQSISIGLIFGVIGVLQFQKIELREQRKWEDEHVGETPLFRVPLGARIFPTRYMSRGIGYLASCTIPEPLREPLYNIWVKLYSPRVHEIPKPMSEYPTFSDLFTRKIVDGARPIADAVVVGPADGKVIAVGEVTGDYVVAKGVTYGVSSLLGLDSDACHAAAKRGRKLQYCVVYLSPGDYHRFHCPVEFSLESRKHFTGELLPVAEWCINAVRGLFCINERVALQGSWAHGAFYYVAVGALNVGSIVMTVDKEVETNRPTDSASNQAVRSRKFQEVGQKLDKGDEIGYFNLGSTIVMVFESPNDFTWQVMPGDTVLVGEEMGRCSTKGSSDPPLPALGVSEGKKSWMWWGA